MELFGVYAYLYIYTLYAVCGGVVFSQISKGMFCIYDCRITTLANVAKWLSLRMRTDQTAILHSSDC
jgi:hypothetical protein